MPRSATLRSDRRFHSRYAGYFEAQLSRCGVTLNGSAPWDVHVRDERAFGRILRHGSLGLGESYMDGQWECQRIDVLIERLLSQGMDRQHNDTAAHRWLAFMARLQNLQTRARARLVGEQHYDAGNELFEHMLDSYMNYSCGYWEAADSLEQAQQHKMDLVCRKLDLQPGMKVLDLGCGWGGMARYAAEHYGVEVVGVTISREQQAYVAENARGLPVEIRLQDYRDVRGTFDRVMSIGMFEHVGRKNYPAFFEVVRSALRGQGLCLLHTIGSNRSAQPADPWLHRYVFPNGMLPSIAEIGRAIEPHFVVEDWHNFGTDYDLTLMAWHRRVNDAWPALGDRYDGRFQRMWNFYLQMCAAAFRVRNLQLWQVVLSAGRRQVGYRRPDSGPPR